TVRGFSPTGIVLRSRPVAASSALTVLLVSAVTYTLDPSGETAIPSGSTPTAVENLMRPVFTSTPEAWAISSFETKNVAPSGLRATSSGSRPAGRVRWSPRVGCGGRPAGREVARCGAPRVGGRQARVGRGRAGQGPHHQRHFRRIARGGVGAGNPAPPRAKGKRKRLTPYLVK